MINIKRLKEIIQDLPDEMPVLLCDLSTDDSLDSSYSLDEGSIDVGDYTDWEEDEIKGQALWISFDNKISPDKF